MSERLAGEYEAAVKHAAEMLLHARSILILSHSSPDGDTLGSAFALCRALLSSGRDARVECSDELPAKYAYMYTGSVTGDFAPDLIVSSDIASQNLFGDQLEKYKESVGLCIDHHPSNTHYAGFTVLNAKAAATCEIMVDIIGSLGVEIDKDIADCIYTGLATDTGCFRFSNTTPRSLRTAALMIEKGAESGSINKIMFETTSRQRMEAETMALRTLEYHLNDRVAIITVSRDIINATGVMESDMEGIPSIPARIEGVLAGVTIKEKTEGSYKISVRTNGTLNASDICAAFSGGGHKNAAGCSMDGNLQGIKDSIVTVVKRMLDAQ